MKKNPELKLSDIQSLREWCEKQTHLPKIEDSFLALFLHSNYYQMEPTKNTIENYYTIRTHLPEFFCNRDPFKEEGLRQVFNITTYFPLNEITEEGYKIIYGTLLDADSSHYVFNDVMKYQTMIMDMCYLKDGTNNGYTFVIDISKFSFGHVARISPLAMKKILYYVQEAIPCRIKGIHFINALSAMNLVMNMIKPFTKKELINMIYFHSSMESISKYIPINALPNEVGGKGGFIRELAEIQVKQLEEYREWFLLDEVTGRINEDLRINKRNSANNESKCNIA
ncbi:alpha-tocopherol transfer protein-like isoform X2 [Monomorium pharaonis]|nr:alpha-tocopherol transfer protein-like isoform X2 [Monomorium pharaonis]XP_036139670.1 alpha-tocopherol transfer protein-like isoform X2 [Monomorium pharaonis]XP_036139671.1 alpha-tocopherol transfer protein-like isoform X2 [Monomorium pharaonis]